MAFRQKLAQVTDEERSINIEVKDKISCVSSTKVIVFFVSLVPVNKLEKIWISGMNQGILICHVVQSLEHCSHKKRLQHSEVLKSCLKAKSRCWWNLLPLKKKQNKPILRFLRKCPSAVTLLTYGSSTSMPWIFYSQISDFPSN